MEFRFFSSFVLLGAGLMLLGPVLRADSTPTDSDWQQIQDQRALLAKGTAYNARTLSHVEEEQQQLKLRELALRFFERHPSDPRRWNLLMELTPSRPRFVTEWGKFDEENDPIDPVIDATAAADWKAKLTALTAAMREAIDVPEEARARLEARDKATANRRSYDERWNGQMIPDFVMHDLQNRPVKPSDLRGKVVVMDFWATWCIPCVKLMPHVQSIAAKYKDQGVVVLAVSIDDTQSAVARWLKANGGKYPDIVWTQDMAKGVKNRAAIAIFNFSGVPAQVVIGRDGKVVGIPWSWRKDDHTIELMLARAGIKVDSAIVEKGAADLGLLFF